MFSGIKKWGKLFGAMILGVAILTACTGGTEQEQEFLKKAQKGDKEAQYQLSRLYFEGNGVDQSDKKGAYWVRKAAEGGYPLALGDLGMMYALGVMCRKDNVEALKWLTLCEKYDCSGPGIRYMKDLQETMKPEDIQKAKQLAATWKPKVD
ncbi:MAG: sel1 repeat family protein [Oxalobacter sp.]|nr:MAG: sel1 repeat family protein [Oxalobacter sp.]